MMFRIAPRLSALLASCLVLAACAGATDSTMDAARRSTAAVGTGVSQTTSGVGKAMSAPLHDFNLVNEKIPPSLIKALYTPYDMVGMEGCPALLKEIADLDLALGPDLDTPAEPKAHDMYLKGASFAAEAALDAVKDTAEGVVPMKSWVRKLSGAEQADKKIRRAIQAGFARRAFLKGLGVMQNCAWPAAPLNFEPRPPLPTKQVPAAPTPPTGKTP